MSTVSFGNSGTSRGKAVSNATLTRLFITGDNFVTDENRYENIALAGVTNLSVYHRGLGFLLYNPNDLADPINEFTILTTGGIEITIPDFDVHNGENYFYVEAVFSNTTETSGFPYTFPLTLS